MDSRLLVLSFFSSTLSYLGAFEEALTRPAGGKAKVIKLFCLNLQRYLDIYNDNQPKFKELASEYIETTLAYFSITITRWTICDKHLQPILLDDGLIVKLSIICSSLLSRPLTSKLATEVLLINTLILDMLYDNPISFNLQQSLLYGKGFIWNFLKAITVASAQQDPPFPYDIDYVVSRFRDLILSTLSQPLSLIAANKSLNYLTVEEKESLTDSKIKKFLEEISSKIDEGMHLLKLIEKYSGRKLVCCAYEKVNQVHFSAMILNLFVFSGYSVLLSKIWIVMSEISPL
jgi:hypothetical protein